jgi:ApeA N-terminal domain 1
MILLITFTWSLPGPQKTTEAKITQKTYFELSSKRERSIEDYKLIAYKITTFIGFAIDKTVCLGQVSATTNSISQPYIKGETLPIRIFVVYPSQPYTKEAPIIDSYYMLFNYGQIQKDAERLINNWIDAYDEIAPALNLYFSTKIGAQRYVDGKFLALVQALETYHRRTSDEKLMAEETFKELVKTIVDQCPEDNKNWLEGRLKHGNELSLSQRIKAIIKPFKDKIGTSKEREKLINKITETRHYLTHYDKNSESKVSTDGKDLYVLCLKLEVIFQLHLLQILGFEKDEINSIAINSQQIQHKIQYKSK